MLGGVSQPDRLSDGLNLIETLYRRISALGQQDVDAGGRAAALWPLPFGRYAVPLAGQALHNAADHLHAWVQLNRAGEIPLFAHMTLLRTAFEGTVRCRWLVDAKASAVEITRRVALATYEDIVERRKFLESMAEADVLLRRARRREKACLKLIGRCGWTSRNGIVPPINVADLFRDYALTDQGGGIWLWRVTSGFAHGREWALTSGEIVGQVRGEAGHRRVEIRASKPIAGNVTMVAAILLADATAEFEAFTQGGAPSPPS